MDTLKGELEKARSFETAMKPGALELTIANTQVAESGRIQAILEGVNGKAAEETLTGENKRVRIGVVPGQYRITLRATVGGSSVPTSRAIIIKPGEIAKAELSFPI
jgi:hypothetical protein